MKTVKMTIAFAFVLSLGCISLAQTNWMDWRYGRPGVQVVTNAPSRAEHAALSNTVAGISSVSIGVVTDLIANAVAPLASTGTVAALSSSVDATNTLFSAWFSGLHSRTSYWNTAYSWGDHAGLYKNVLWFPSWTEVTGKPDLFDWSYDSLTNKPATFPPSAHTHPHTDITDPPWLTSFTETDEIALSRVTVLEGKTNNWNTAYGWGNHSGLYKASDWVPSWMDVTGKPATFPPEAHQHDYTAITNPPWLEEYTETDPIWTGVSNTVTVGAALGATAVQAESDPVAMAALSGYQSAAYWPPNATASSWFTFITNSGAITITAYNIDGVTDVVIPDYINGWPVTKIGAGAFAESGVMSIGGAGNVVTVGNSAFYYCFSLTSVSLPQVRTVGYSAFYDCNMLTSVSLPQVRTVGYYAFYGCGGLTSLYFDNDAPTIGDEIFAEITPNQVTVYVTNPQATGWGATFADMPVVRVPLYADAIYQAGELVATTQHVAQAIAAIEFPVASTNYTAWTGTVTPADGTATVTIAHGNMPVLVADAPCVLTLDPTGYGTAGVSRVSLSYYTGTNSLTFATDIIKYAETPTVDTNGWNTLLIRRVSNGAWKGVGL